MNDDAENVERGSELKKVKNRTVTKNETKIKEISKTSSNNDKLKNEFINKTTKNRTKILHFELFIVLLLILLLFYSTVLKVNFSMDVKRNPDNIFLTNNSLRSANDVVIIIEFLGGMGENQTVLYKWIEEEDKVSPFEQLLWGVNIELNVIYIRIEIHWENGHDILIHSIE